jgi:2-dehydro-3-deoxy-L-rhamnonate dehydrogenase (NAD+)
MNKIDLGNRAAIVTGGARGIGYACAERLLQSGAIVMLWDQDAPALEQAVASLRKAGTVHSTVVDVTQETSVDSGAQAAIATMGKIDVLINNAGITGPNKTTWEYAPSEWRKVIDVDLTGAFLCLRAIVPGMLARRYGRIVNIASVAGKEGNPNAPAYSAAKAGLIGLTKSLAKEVGSRGITVNAVAPGFIETEMTAQLGDSVRERALSLIAAGRMGTADEVAAAITFLASPGATYVNGCILNVDGGIAS